MPRNTPRHDVQPDPAMLAEVAAVLEQLAGHRRADAADGGPLSPQTAALS